MKLHPFFIFLIFWTSSQLAQAGSQSSAGDCSPNLGDIAGNVTIHCNVAKQAVRLKENIEYFVGGTAPKKTLLARTDGKTYQTYAAPEGTLHLVDVRDYDLDGYLDALVAISSGGNCCPQSFVIISYRGRGVFKTLTHEKFYSWDNPTFELVDDKWKIRVDTGLDGVGFSSLEINMAIFTIGNGRIEVIETSSQKAIVPALAELSSSGYSDGKTPHDQPIKLLFDLDRDGRADVILCEYWERWGSLTCDILTSSKGHISLNYGCDRLGVVDEVDYGMNKLVCNSDVIMRYDPTQNLFVEE